MEDSRDFHPEDPTVSLWKKLIRGPRKKRGPMSKAEKERRAKALRLHYLDNVNPNSLHPERDKKDD